jgi:hypothetical protein
MGEERWYAAKCKEWEQYWNKKKAKGNLNI